jgi:hypothetical protein
VVQEDKVLRGILSYPIFSLDAGAQSKRGEKIMPIFSEGKRVQDLRLDYVPQPKAPGRDDAVSKQIVRHTLPENFASALSSNEDLVFQKKFDLMRPSLLQTLRNASVIQDHDQVLRAFASHLQEISPKHKCPRWEVIRAAAGWSYFLKTFISDRRKLDDGIYRTDPDVIDAHAFLARQWAELVAQSAQEKEEKARQKARARRGFHSSQALGAISMESGAGKYFVPPV